MNVSKVFSFLSKLPKSSFVANRGVSEYAKRMGYKFVEDPESSNFFVRNVLYSVGSVLMLLGIANDKQKHYEVFTKHCDERKYHFNHEMNVDPAVLPNMDFFLNELRDANAPPLPEINLNRIKNHTAFPPHDDNMPEHIGE